MGGQRLTSMSETAPQALLQEPPPPGRPDHMACSHSPEPEAWASSYIALVGKLSAYLKGKDILDQSVPKHEAGAGLSVTQEDLKEKK